MVPTGGYNNTGYYIYPTCRVVISVLFRLNGGGTGAVRLLYRLLSLLLVLSVLRSRPVRASSCHYALLPDHVQLVNQEAGVPNV